MIHQIKEPNQLTKLDNLTFKPLKELFNKEKFLSMTADINIVQKLAMIRNIRVDWQTRHLKWMMK